MLEDVLTDREHLRRKLVGITPIGMEMQRYVMDAATNTLLKHALNKEIANDACTII